MQTSVLPLEDIFVGELHFGLDSFRKIETTADTIVAPNSPENSIVRSANAESLAIAVEAIVRIYGVLCDVGDDGHGGKMISAP
jgi:hypothetical protein